MIIPYSVNTGKDNMNLDLEMLEKSILNQDLFPKFRVYGWKPACVSLGRNQNDDFLDKKFLKSKNIDIVKRITGGRALLHDNEITYCFVCPITFLKNGNSVLKSYHEISQFLINTFAELDIKITYGEKNFSKNPKQYCMLLSTGADLCYEGKKLIGSAQCRKNGYILQHGSILYDYDEETLRKIFPKSEIEENITSIKNINPNLSKTDIITALYTNFEELNIHKNN